MTKDEALKLALEALCKMIPCDDVCDCTGQRAITAIKEALAQPEQEPVAFEEWLSNQHGDPEEIGFLQALRIAYISGQDSIITPPQRKPLTDEKISDAVREADFDWHYGWTLDDEEPNRFTKFARAIEAAHGIYAPTERKGGA